MHGFFTPKIVKSKYGKNYQLGIELYEETLSISEERPQLFYNRVKSIRQNDMLIEALKEFEEKNKGTKN